MVNNPVKEASLLALTGAALVLLRRSVGVSGLSVRCRHSAFAALWILGVRWFVAIAVCHLPAPARVY